LPRRRNPRHCGLPLGIHPDADYQETQFTLPAGQSLTFLSDGVVEARNASGELFGFDRTLAISDSGADAIAQMAVAFGQDDDITVLTLRREAAAIPWPFPAHAVVLSSV
jgi:serine phosphatase RsbU (regulator of sigma subunit)